MCLEEYVGCPDCFRAADSGEVFSITYQTEAIHYFLDTDGCTSYDNEPDYQESSIQSEDDGYGCDCGWRGHSLATDCVREDCECDECNPDAAEEEGEEPEQEVILHLAHNFPPEVDKDTPPEIRFLAKDAFTWYLAIPRWRGAELSEDYGTEVRVTLNPPFSVSDEARVFTYDHDNREVVSA